MIKWFRNVYNLNKILKDNSVMKLTITEKTKYILDLQEELLSLRKEMSLVPQTVLFTTYDKFYKKDWKIRKNLCKKQIVDKIKYSLLPLFEFKEKDLEDKSLIEINTNIRVQVLEVKKE